MCACVCESFKRLPAAVGLERLLSEGAKIRSCGGKIIVEHMQKLGHLNYVMKMTCKTASVGVLYCRAAFILHFNRNTMVF